MPLGNNMSMGQARGKAKPVLVKRRKEVVTARDYTEIQASAVQGSFACSHTGDRLYTKKRANSKFYPANGHIKVGPDRGRYSNIEVTDGAVRAPGGIVCP